MWVYKSLSTPILPMEWPVVTHAQWFDINLIIFLPKIRIVEDSWSPLLPGGGEMLTRLKIYIIFILAQLFLSSWMTEYCAETHVCTRRSAAPRLRGSLGRVTKCNARENLSTTLRLTVIPWEGGGLCIYSRPTPPTCCLLYVLAFNVRTYCMLYLVIVLSYGASYPSYLCCIQGIG